MPAAVHDGGLVHPQGERLTGIAADNFSVIYQLHSIDSKSVWTVDLEIMAYRLA